LYDLRFSESAFGIGGKWKIENKIKMNNFPIMIQCICYIFIRSYAYAVWERTLAQIAYRYVSCMRKCICDAYVQAFGCNNKCIMHLHQADGKYAYAFIRTHTQACTLIRIRGNSIAVTICRSQKKIRSRLKPINLNFCVLTKEQENLTKLKNILNKLIYN
jgi:hypothetical protein